MRVSDIFVSSCGALQVEVNFFSELLEFRGNAGVHVLVDFFFHGLFLQGRRTESSEMQRTPETDPALRTGGAAPAWTQLPQLNAAVSPSSPAAVAP
jgi:hypothetical protein